MTKINMKECFLQPAGVLIMSSHNTENVLIGEIRYFPYVYVPEGFLPCDGQVLEIKDPYQPLFALIGNQFGGSAPRDFRLPNLNKNLPDKNCKYYIAVYGNWPARSD